MFRTRTGRGAFSLLIAVLVLAMSAGVASSHDPAENHRHGEQQGLGSYGPEGPIARSDLPDSISDLVSDDALVLAESDELKNAREGWDDPIDFVDQVDYQLSFRTASGFLDTSAAHIGMVLEQRANHDGFDILRLYLTVEEWAEIVDRQERADRHLPRIRAAMGVLDPAVEGDDPVYGDTYGGTWTDRESGRLVVAATSFDEQTRKRVTDVARGEDVMFVEQPFSFAEQGRIKSALAEELARLDVEFELIAETSPTGRHLILTVPKPDAVAELVKSLDPDGAVRVVQGAGVRVEVATDTVHSAGAQQPGLRIEVWDVPSNGQGGGFYNQRCTWGVNGHTNTYNYMITAGHCLTGHPNHVGRLYAPEFKVRQGSTSGFDLTGSSAFVVSQTSSSPSSGITDAARIQSGYANDNCYHGSVSLSGGGHCAYSIRYRASHMSWEIGSDVTCASSGKTTTWRCGWILEEYAVTATLGRLVRNSMASQIGDSGSGMLGNGNTIDGIHVAGSGSNAYFVTAYDVKRLLGFDYNCASTAVARAANQWGSCPIINR